MGHLGVFGGGGASPSPQQSKRTTPCNQLPNLYRETQGDQLPYFDTMFRWSDTGNLHAGDKLNPENMLIAARNEMNLKILLYRRWCELPNHLIGIRNSKMDVQPQPSTETRGGLGLMARCEPTPSWPLMSGLSADVALRHPAEISDRARPQSFQATAGMPIDCGLPVPAPSRCCDPVAAATMPA